MGQDVKPTSHPPTIYYYNRENRNKAGHSSDAAEYVRLNQSIERYVGKVCRLLSTQFCMHLSTFAIVPNTEKNSKTECY